MEELGGLTLSAGEEGWKKGSHGIKKGLEGETQFGESEPKNPP